MPASDGWLVVDRAGGVARVAGDGAMTTSPISAGAWAGFESIRPATLVRFADGFVAARSPFADPGIPEPPDAPLLLRLSPSGDVIAPIDTVRALSDWRLTRIASSGHLASSDSLVFFAHLLRDEIRAYDRAGRLRWTADRGMTWHRPPVASGANPPDISYRTVNLSITVRDGLVYVLAFADSAATAMRVDAFDPGTGVLRKTGTLPASTMLISIDPKGALWHAPPEALDSIAAPTPSAKVVEFDLPTFSGDTLGLRSLRGKVVLLNIWASWCDPCRDEFPLMTRLTRELAADDFAVVAVSDDVDRDAARRFLAEYEPPFATVWGRGSLRDMLGYRGLPFTVLLDREGRVVERYIGFGGASQFEALRADIARLIKRP